MIWTRLILFPQTSNFRISETMIKMILKGRSPTRRHGSRTHRVALDWLFARINLKPKNPNQAHRDQKPIRRHANQGKFHTCRNNLLRLFNTNHFSSTVCSETLAKRLQQDSGEERVTAKSRLMMAA